MHILMIDDEVKLCEKIGKFLKLKGHQMLQAHSGEEGLSILQNHTIDLILLDLRMPGMDGLTCLKQIRSQGIKSEVIIISAHGEIPDAVQAMKLGAYDYLTKPFYLEELLNKIQQLEKHQTHHEDEKEQSKNPTHSLIYASPQMQQLMTAAQRVAPADTPVLLTGETGVGKEVMARWIHQQSGRKGNFVAINCGAIPENLVESELFGHEKGAFSGAHQRKPGKLEVAQKGTLFLDEIGELPKDLQVKLLRVLQEKEMERIGGITPIALDIRVIAATNRDLSQEIRDGRFREDLYYRLNVFTFHIPPLRERKADILPLTRYFLAEFNQKLKTHFQQLSPEAESQLLAYNYPGNIRELKNLIERSMILSTGNDLEIHFHLKSPEEITAPQHQLMVTATDETLTLAELEVLRIKEALQKHHGNRTRAAEELGISRRTIINKIKQYNLQNI